jgi:uncharacterized membrane protein YcaP (DUF421 family)
MMFVIISRTLIIFAAILVSMRLMGKRQLGELELSELVVAVLVSDFAVIPLQDLSVPVWNGVVPVAVLLVCEVVISKLALKSIKLRSFLSGTPSVIIENGVINQTEMRKNRISIDELDEALRKKQILNVADVRYALLETDGTLSTILYSGKQPLTAGQFGAALSDEAVPLPVIVDGRILSSNLQKLQSSAEWLERELKRRKVRSVKDVYLMTAYGGKCVFFALKDGAKSS